VALGGTEFTHNVLILLFLYCRLQRSKDVGLLPINFWKVALLAMVMAQASVSENNLFCLIRG
jgi:thymidylate synthase